MSQIKVPNSVLKFNALESDLSTSVATALWNKAAAISEYVNKSVPVGKIMWFRDTQDQLPEMPDPKYWQELDGSKVTNPASPLNGVTLPDLRDLYIKHPGSSETNQAASGSDTRDLSHNHGGFTGYDTAHGDFNADDDDERAGPYNHRHSIALGLTGSRDIKPPFFGLRFYIRIV